MYQAFRRAACRPRFNERRCSAAAPPPGPAGPGRDVPRALVRLQPRDGAGLRGCDRAVRTRRTSRHTGCGATCVRPSVPMGTWWTRRSAGVATCMRPGAPEKATTDGHAGYACAIREVPGKRVSHRCGQCLNPRIEQDHRGIEGRYGPVPRFGSFHSAAHLCSGFDEVRHYFPYHTKMHQVVPVGAQRERFRARPAALREMRRVAEALGRRDPPRSYAARCPYQPSPARELDATATASMHCRSPALEFAARWLRPGRVARPHRA